MSQCLSTIWGKQTNKQNKTFFLSLQVFDVATSSRQTRFKKITCSCKSSETPGHRREPSIQSDMLGSTLFQSFSIIIQPHQSPWGCCGNTAKIPVMSFVCATTQQWRISKRWYTCCQTDAKCLHLITGSRCWFVWSHFPSLPDFKNGGLEFCKGLALMTHRMMPLTGPSAACCLLTCSQILGPFRSPMEQVPGTTT